jgi:uncharacterized protein
MPKARSWLRNRKKTEPEVPYEPPFWFGDHSNGEQYHSATEKDQLMRKLILEKGAEQARHHGVERREFMASGLGIALSMYVMNLVNGCDGGARGGFSFDSEGGSGALGQTGGIKEVMDPVECEVALDATKTFIFDIQTHRVETDNGVYRNFIAGLPQAMCGKQTGPTGPLACFTKDEYVREMFLDSDTTMTVLSGVPAVDGVNPLTNEQIAETRDFVHGIASDSERVITHAMVLPNYKHQAQLDGMAKIVAERAPIGAWKCYTPWGPGDGVTGFWLDDPKIGIPFLERGRQLGIKTFCCHKGLPLPSFDNNYGDPKDIGVVAKRFPDCSFIVYHSAYQFGVPPRTASEVEGLPYKMGDKAGVNSLITACLQNGHGVGSNIYGELGTTWISVMNNPVRATHILGKLLKYLGEDNVVWGTDSMWYGSPQPQILAFLRFKMDQRIRETEGYPDLTDGIKAKILGLNAAKLFKVDPTQKRCQIEAGAIAGAKRDLDDEFGRYRWAFQQPRLTNRRDFLRNVAFHRAAKTPG